ncbi:MAG: hypothetical protein CUN54_01215 [Phototrophicales bacterium]|nr:MAG: hypothetical protein CUN54_01215 [Phototrophicales bacterium]
MKLNRNVAFIFILLLIITVLSASIAAAAPTAQLQQPILVVNSDVLNVRTGPGFEFPVMFSVPRGTPLPVIAQIGDGVWFQVSTTAGPGWVNALFTTVRGTLANAPVVPRPALPPPPPPPGAAPAPGAAGVIPQAAGVEVVVNTARLNIRRGPGIEFRIITSVVGGTRLNVVGRANDNVWLLVEGRFGRGWLNSTLTLVRGDIGLLPIIRDIEIATGRSAAPARVEAVVNTGQLNIRSGPGVQFSIVTSVIGGTTLRVIGIADDGVWLLVRGNFGRGWVNRNFTLVRGDVGVVPIINDSFGGTRPAPATPEAIINTGRLNIRSGPGVQWSVVTSLPGGSSVDVIGRAGDGVWLLVEGQFGRGWINRNFALVRGDVSLLPIFPA